MRLIFYLLFYPLSLLPLWLLYGIAYLFYLVIHYVVRYRRNIITQNLEKSFPEKSKREIASLRRKYYLHLSQIAAEMLKMLTLSRHQVMRRYRCENPEIVNQFFEQGKSGRDVLSAKNTQDAQACRAVVRKDGGRSAALPARKSRDPQWGAANPGLGLWPYVGRWTIQRLRQSAGQRPEWS